MEKHSEKYDKPLKMSIPGYNKTSIYTEDFALSSIQNKQVTHYFLPGDQDDSLRLQIIFADALKLRFQCDSSKVIQIQFGHNSTFGSIYAVLKFLTEHTFRKYCLIGRSFYIFGVTNECHEEKNKLIQEEQETKLLEL